MSHDWPVGIEHHGDLQGLLRRKPFFREDVKNGKLGSPPLMGLLQNLKPEWWFAAHLHVKFTATVRHYGQEGPGDGDNPVAGQSNKPPVTNPDEIVIDDDDDVPPEAQATGECASCWGHTM